MKVMIDKLKAAVWEWTGSTEKDYEWSRDDIETVVGRVNQGAQLLDAEKPGWRQSVLPDQLDMRSAEFCIIGQTYGTYSQYIRVPFGLDRDEDSEEMAIAHGFLTHFGPDYAEESIPYELLDLVWVELLRQRAQRGTDDVLLELPPRQPRNAIIQSLRDAALIT